VLVNGQPPPAGAAATLLAEMFESASAGLAVLRGQDLIFEAANPAFEALARERSLVGRAAANACPELLKRVIPMAARVLETGEPRDLRDVPLMAPRAPGAAQRRYLTFRLRRLTARGEEARVWVAFMETTLQVRARQRAELLTSFAASLSSHPELSAVVHRTLRRAVALLGGAHGALWLLDPDGWTLRAAYGSPVREVRHETFDVRSFPTFQKALQTRSAVFVRRAHLADAEAELFERLHISAGLMAPLAAGPRQLGLLTMSFAETSVQPDEEELAFASALAAQSALAIERARAIERTRRARVAADAAQARFRLLADVGRILSAALDWESAVHAATRLALGRLADWAILDLVDAAGELRRESICCGPQQAPAPGWAPVGAAVDRDDPGLEEVLRTRLTRSWDLTLGDEPVTPASTHLTALRAAGARHVLLAPLAVGNEVLGCLTLARAAGVRSYDREDLTLTQELAARIALALQNARLLRAAESVVEARDEFMAMARHELRTPLTALRLELGQLARTPPEDDRTRHRVRVIQRATERLTRSVEQLFDIAHIENGELVLHREPLELVGLAHEVVARLSTQLERVGCRVNVVAPPQLVADGDRLRVKGIFNHLLDHAARLGSGKPIDLVVSKRHGRAAVEVRYRGPPIPPELWERLVVPLERSAPKLKFAELGLGLWIARWMLHAHGGRLLLRTWSEGDAFVAELPLDPPEHSEARRADRESHPTTDGPSSEIE
jgi:signal transduction histidine kinase